MATQIIMDVDIDSFFIYIRFIYKQYGRQYPSPRFTCPFHYQNCGISVYIPTIELDVSLLLLRERLQNSFVAIHIYDVWLLYILKLEMGGHKMLLYP